EGGLPHEGEWRDGEDLSPRGRGGDCPRERNDPAARRLHEERPGPGDPRGLAGDGREDREGVSERLPARDRDAEAVPRPGAGRGGRDHGGVRGERARREWRGREVTHGSAASAAAFGRVAESRQVAAV